MMYKIFSKKNLGIAMMIAIIGQGVVPVATLNAQTIDPAKVTSITEANGLKLTKSVTHSDVVPGAIEGDELWYYYEIENTSSAPITGISIVDPLDDAALDNTNLINSSGMGSAAGYCPVGGVCTDITPAPALDSILTGETLGDLQPGDAFKINLHIMCKTGADYATADADIDSTAKVLISGNILPAVKEVSRDYYKASGSTGGGNTGGGNTGGGGSHHSGGGSNGNADGGSFTTVSPDGNTTEGKDTTTSSDSTSNDLASTNTESSKTSAKWGSEEATTISTTDSTENKVVDETNEAGKTPVIWEM